MDEVEILVATRNQKDIYIADINRETIEKNTLTVAFFNKRDLMHFLGNLDPVLRITNTEIPLEEVVNWLPDKLVEYTPKHDLSCTYI